MEFARHSVDLGTTDVLRVLQVRLGLGFSVWRRRAPSRLLRPSPRQACCGLRGACSRGVCSAVVLPPPARAGSKEGARARRPTAPLLQCSPPPCSHTLSPAASPPPSHPAAAVCGQAAAAGGHLGLLHRLHRAHRPPAGTVPTGRYCRGTAGRAAPSLSPLPLCVCVCACSSLPLSPFPSPSLPLPLQCHLPFPTTTPTSLSTRRRAAWRPPTWATRASWSSAAAAPSAPPTPRPRPRPAAPAAPLWSSTAPRSRSTALGTRTSWVRGRGREGRLLAIGKEAVGGWVGSGSGRGRGRFHARRRTS